MGSMLTRQVDVAYNKAPGNLAFMRRFVYVPKQGQEGMRYDVCFQVCVCVCERERGESVCVCVRVFVQACVRACLRLHLSSCMTYMRACVGYTDCLPCHSHASFPQGVDGNEMKSEKRCFGILVLAATISWTELMPCPRTVAVSVEVLSVSSVSCLCLQCLDIRFSLYSPCSGIAHSD